MDIKEGEIVKPESIALTPEQKQADLKIRSDNFKTDLKELVQKHQVDLGAQLNYTPQGAIPQVVMVDIKK